MTPEKIRPGRPKGIQRDTKAKIAKVATKQFSELVYDKTTIRSVAEAANVDRVREALARSLCLFDHIS